MRYRKTSPGEQAREQAAESEHVLVAALLQKPSRLAEVGRLSPAYFGDEGARGVFALALGYNRQRGGRNALDVPLARGLLERSDTKTAARLLSLVDEYAVFAPVTDPEWREALASVVAERQRRTLEDRGSAALEAAMGGDREGAQGAMRAALQEVGDASIDDDRPTDVRSALEMQAEREALARPAVEGDRFDVGFPWLQKACQFRRKDLLVLGGYSGDGKTSLAKAFVYNASQAGATCLFVALEMDKREMRTLFVAQHAATIDPRGVPWTEILDGTASLPDRRLYERALDDFEVRPAEGELAVEGERIEGRAGSIFVWAPTKRRICMSDFCDRVRILKEEEDLDIAVADYLGLIRPDRKSEQHRLDVKEQCDQGKALAREAGILAVLNHQISRPGRDAAEKRDPPHYTSRDLGESSGVEQAADEFVWIFSDDDLKEMREARVGTGKARKGNTVTVGRRVMADFSRAIVAPLDEGA